MFGLLLCLISKMVATKDTKQTRKGSKEQVKKKVYFLAEKTS